MKKQNSITSGIAETVFMLFSAVLLVQAAASAAKPPNFLLLLADDMAYTDLG